MIWLQWLTCAVVTVLVIVRLPAFVRGTNRLMFGLMAFLDLAVLLSIEAPYLAVDSLLGGRNVANLLLRFIIYGFALLLAIRVARAFAGYRAERALVGPWGLGFLAVCSGGLVLTFVMTNMTTSRVGFATDGLELWPAVYGTLGRVYPTFTGLAVMPALLATAGRRGPVLLRTAAAALAAGYALLAVSNIITVLPNEATAFSQVINYGTILLVCVGLTLVWISSLNVRRRERAVRATQSVKNPPS
ncbi:MAG: hypothetical protein HOQ07_11310 [Sinomonas sp.]|nr:hypothetical protein [Sinomonas sp.]